MTPRSRLLAVAMIEKPGLAKTMLSLSSSGIEMYFSDRIEISASWTSLVERVSSSNRPIDAGLHRGHDRRGDHRLPRLALRDDHGHVPRVLDVVLGGAGGALHDQRGVAADRGGQQLGQPALAGAGVADEQQAAVGGEGDDGALDEAAVAEPLLRDLPVEAVGALGAQDEQADHLRGQAPGERLRAVVDGLQPVQFLGVLDLGGGAQQVRHGSRGPFRRGTS